MRFKQTRGQDGQSILVPAVDTLDFIMRYESGELESEEEFVEGFQSLIDSGLAYSLQGHYGRTAASLIRAGLCTPRA